MNNYRYLMYSIVLTVLGFGIWIGLEDHEKIFESIRLIGWSGFGFVCLFSLVNYFFRYIRWRLLFGYLGDRVPFLDGLLCYVAGYALTTTPAKAGEAIRCIYFQRRHGVHHEHTLASILSERTSDAIASMLLASLVVYQFEHLRWLGVALVVLILTIIVGINMPTIILRITALLRIIRFKWFNSLLDLVPLFLQRSSTLLSWRPLSIGTLIALVSWSAEGIGFAWLAHQLGGTQSTALYMSIFAIGMVAGALTFLPGGLGSAELVMYGLLTLTGMGHAEALTTTLLCRLATLWFAVALGLLSIVWLENVSWDEKGKT